jgi:hypothetical protein
LEEQSAEVLAAAVQTAVDLTAVDLTAVDPTAVGPTAVDPAVVDPTAVDLTVEDPTAVAMAELSDSSGEARKEEAFWLTHLIILHPEEEAGCMNAHTSVRRVLPLMCDTFSETMLLSIRSRGRL